MVMPFCLSVHFMYANLKVGSVSTPSCIFSVLHNSHLFLRSHVIRDLSTIAAIGTFPVLCKEAQSGNV